MRAIKVSDGQWIRRYDATASRREAAQGERAVAHLRGRTEMRCEQVGGSATNMKEGSGQHQAREQRGGQEGAWRQEGSSISSSSSSFSLQI